MTNHICVTCGVQYAESEAPPEHCFICEDERQYVGWGGQQWTTLDELQITHRNRVMEMEDGLFRTGSVPHFGIDQHAYLVRSPSGNVLWDCLSLIDEPTIEEINEHGGIQAIAISHPHYYAAMVEWSRAFADAPIYLHAADREWVMRPDPAVVHWEGESHDLWDGLTLIHGGGHFAGGAMLHWPDGADGKGVLLPGDIIQVVHDRRWVSWMYSYVNLIPLAPTTVRRVVEAVQPYDFERIYSPWTERVVMTNGKEVVRRSADRYLKALEG
jgi:hypothetical protein